MSHARRLSLCLSRADLPLFRLDSEFDCRTVQTVALRCYQRQAAEDSCTFKPAADDFFESFLILVIGREN